MIWYLSVDHNHYFAAAVVLNLAYNHNLFYWKNNKNWFCFVWLWDKKTILILFIYIKIIWYAPLLFQFKRIAKCVLFIISWEMAHARIAFGSKIEPKMLPINKQIKTVMIYIHCSILNICLKNINRFFCIWQNYPNSNDWKIS